MAEETKKKVMVAIDESDCSYYALQWVLDNLGDTVSDSHLVIFTAQPADFSYVYASTMGVALPISNLSAPNLITTIQENQKKIAVSLLGKAKEICAKHGIDAETMTEAGDPKEMICAAVEKLNIELLVVGSHSRGTIQRALLGSVSNYCVHNAKCPVLVVRKPI